MPPPPTACTGGWPGSPPGPRVSSSTWWAEELAHLFVTELGVADNPEKLLDLDTASLVAALRKVTPTDLGVRGGIDSKSLGVVLDIGQPGAVLDTHPMDALASGAHRDVDVLLSMASDDMGWWVANDLDRFDPGAVDRIVDEVAGWRIPRSRAKQIVDGYDRGGRTPAEVRAALLTDYIFGLPAARGALAHTMRRRQRPSPSDRARRGRARRARHRDVRPGRSGAAGPQRGTGRA